MMRALNSVSRLEVRHAVRVMHPVRVLGLDVKFPLVNTRCLLAVIVQGQVIDELGYRHLYHQRTKE